MHDSRITIRKLLSYRRRQERAQAERAQLASHDALRELFGKPKTRTTRGRRSRLLVALAIVTCIISGCTPTKEDQAADLVYTQDLRTGLCFAIYTRGDNRGRWGTEVPCSPEVMMLVQR
jgi:hypothetical protein